ncbi:MAG: DUF3037 domain-containing protein [Dermatophilaceae bacterium]
MIPYQYLVLRCVPRVDREEFVNVGVVLYAQDAGFLDAAFHVDTARLAAFAPDLDIAAVTEALRVVCDVCRGLTGRGRPTLATPGRRFGWLAAPRSTVVQPGPVHGGLTDDPDAALADLTDRLVR